MTILETERLVLRELEPAIDAEFVFELLNSPKFIEYIGDRGVRSVEEAAAFIAERYRASYHEHGYGLYAVDLRSGDAASGTLPTGRVSASAAAASIGICGFVKREHFEFPDIGFAFLPEFEGKGYGYESAVAVLEHGRNTLGFNRVLAITSPDNDVSVRLLTKLGFEYQQLFEQPGGDTVKLFQIDL